MCLSYNGTMKIIQKNCEDHDIEAKYWAEGLLDKIYNPVSDFKVLPRIGSMGACACIAV